MRAIGHCSAISAQTDQIDKQLRAARLASASTVPSASTSTRNLDAANPIPSTAPPTEVSGTGDHSYTQSQPRSQQTQIVTQSVIDQSDLLPTGLQAHTTRIPTVTHVPKSARAVLAQVLADTLYEVVDHPLEEKSWIRLQILARGILVAKPKGQTGSVESQAAAVKARIRRWRQGEAGSLW